MSYLFFFFLFEMEMSCSFSLAYGIISFVVRRDMHVLQVFIYKSMTTGIYCENWVSDDRRRLVVANSFEISNKVFQFHKRRMLFCYFLARSWKICIAWKGYAGKQNNHQNCSRQETFFQKFLWLFLAMFLENLRGFSLEPQFKFLQVSWNGLES